MSISWSELQPLLSFSEESPHIYAIFHSVGEAATFSDPFIALQVPLSTDEVGYYEVVFPQMKIIDNKLVLGQDRSDDKTTFIPATSLTTYQKRRIYVANHPYYPD